MLCTLRAAFRSVEQAIHVGSPAWYSSVFRPQ